MTTDKTTPTPSDEQKPTDEKGANINPEKETDKAVGDKETEAKKPTDEEAKLLKEVMKLKEERKKQQREIEDLKSQYGNATPEEVKELLQKQKDEETKALEAKGEYERIKQQLVEEHNKSLQERDDKIKSLEQQLLDKETTINNLTIGSEFSKSKFIADELILPTNKAKELYGGYFDVVDGAIVGFDKPKGQSERTMLVDSQGNPLSFDEAMNKIINLDPDRDSIIKSKVKSGANSTDKPKSGGAISKKTLSSLEKIQAGISNLTK